MYRFGPFTLDTGRRRLLRDGEPVPVPPKALDVLAVLLERRGRTVEKDDLMQRVWPDTAVEEANLTQSIFMLRRAIGDEPSEPRYITTVARRGYRFVGDAIEIGGDQEAVESPVASGSLIAGHLPLSIAVLPFTLLGISKDDEYLGIGMADALITCLSNVRGVVVRSTSAVRQLTETPQDLAGVGRALHVDAIVEATMQRTGDRVRVTAQLVDVRTRTPVWAERFEEASTDLFAIQDAIAQRVASSLAPHVSPDERRRLEIRRTANVDAYHAYLRGRYHWAKRDAQGVERAIAWFRQAIDLDPAYALAHVGLADSYVILRAHGWPAFHDAASIAKSAISMALEIDDHLAEAHATRGILRMFCDWDWKGAEASLQRAIELAPNYAVARNWYANCLAASGRFDESIRQARQAVVLDPMSTIWCAGVGNMLLLARRYDEAVKQALSALDMEPRFFIAHWTLGMAFEQMGDLTRAVEALRRADKDSGPNLLSRGLLGRILALAGSEEEARGILADLTSGDGRMVAPPEAVALVHAGLGETEAAFDWLERAAREGGFFLTYLNVSPLFDSLRSHPRFAALQRRIRLA